MTTFTRILFIAVCTVTRFVSARGQISLPADEYLLNSTTYLSRITDTIVEGQKKRFVRGGTGFFFNLERNKDTIPGIITNRHVIEDMDSCVLKFNILTDKGIQYGLFVSVTIPVKDNPSIFYHPEADLAFIKLEPVLDLLKKKYTGGRPTIAFAPFKEKNIVPDSDQKTIGVIAPVLMVSYPENLYDRYNYIPVVSEGITATPYFSDYNGNHEFMVDIPALSGTSGAPIVLYNPDQKGIESGSELSLLGIDAQMVTSAKTGLPVNLCIGIKASQILYFKTVVQ